MQVYFNDITWGIISFPFVAFLFTLPYAIVQYRRYGAIPLFNTVLIYALIFYAICAYYLVILPLPDPATVTPPGHLPQLNPLRAFQDVLITTKLSFDVSTWLPAIRSSCGLQILFNILLTMPIGFYLCYFFRKRWWWAIIIGFCVSLFFELTQLSGLYGIYSAAYRQFDVDDLLCNTFGAWLGFVLTIPLKAIMPSPQQARDRAIEKRDTVSPIHRMFTTIIDGLITVVLILILDMVSALLPAGMQSIFLKASVALAFFLVFVVVPTITGGFSIGQRILRVRVVSVDGAPATRLRIALRSVVLYYVLLPLPLYATYGWMLILGDVGFSTFLPVEAAFVLLLIIILIVRIVRSHWTHTFTMLHGLLTHTRVAAQ